MQAGPEDFGSMAPDMVAATLALQHAPLATILDYYVYFPALIEPLWNHQAIMLGASMDRPLRARQSGIFGDHGRVQPSIRPCVAAHRPQALMIFTELRSLSRLRTSRPMRPAG